MTLELWKAVVALILAAALVVSLALTGCSFEFSVGGSNEIDSQKAEDAISGSLADSYGEPPTSVSCPEGVESVEGDTFTCTGESPEGDGFSLLVTISSDEGDIRYPLTVDWDEPQ